MIQTERKQLSYGWRRSYILAAKCLVTAAFLIVTPNSSFAGDPPGGDPPGGGGPGGGGPGGGGGLPDYSGYDQEQYAFSHEVLNPGYDSTFETSWSLPKFDTLGDTRQLVAYRVDYLASFATSSTFAPNPTEFSVGAKKTWTMAWEGVVGGETMFPEPGTPDLFPTPYALSTVIDPFATGGGPFAGPLSEILTPRVYDQPSQLSNVIGSGLIDITSRLSMSDVVTSEVLPEDVFPPPFGSGPPDVYEPDSVSHTVDLLSMQMTMTYYWEPVPEPATACLLGLGAVAVFGTRRRTL